MIAYTCFKCSEDFEKWQDENPQFSVCQIQPVLDGLDFDFKDKEEGVGTAQGMGKIKVFVTYKK